MYQSGKKAFRRALLSFSPKIFFRHVDMQNLAADITIFWVRIFSWFEFESHPWRPKGGPQKFVNKIQNKGHRSQKRFRL